MPTRIGKAPWTVLAVTLSMSIAGSFLVPGFVSTADSGTLSCGSLFRRNGDAGFQGLCSEEGTYRLLALLWLGIALVGALVAGAMARRTRRRSSNR